MFDHTYAELQHSFAEMPEHNYADLSGSVCSGTNAIDVYPQLKDWLPNQSSYCVCHYEEVASLGDHIGFNATLRVDVRTVEQVKEWVDLLTRSSGVTWRVDFTRPCLGQRVLFKASYRCQHLVRRSGIRSKNTCCEARMHMTLKRIIVDMSRSNDPHMPDLPLEVRISNRHNHNLHVADALRYRDVGEKAIEVLTGLFELGHTPTSALAVLKHDLQMGSADYVRAAANREICPDLKFAQRLFQKVCREEYGCQSGPSMLAALESQVEAYNTKCKDRCAAMSTSSRGEPLVVVCSPLMKRVHLTKLSGELCFIDSSGNMDRENCRVFLLLTHSPAGGLPLGILLCQSEDEDTISEGLELLKQLAGEKAFAGRGETGPSIFITDDSKAEQGALARSFPGATLLLCSFHLLQAVWRWLWSRASGVEHKDRPALFELVRDMLYARDSTELERLYVDSRIHPVAVRYDKYLKYTERLYNRRECWALSYRGSLLTRGNNTNNFAEAAMRVLKDRILQRTKAFNPPQLLDLLTSRLEVYYEARIVDIALGRTPSFQASRFLPIDTNIPASQIQQLGDKKFRVQGSKGTYMVDMQVELCSCTAGQTGVPCKHLAAVDKHFACLSSLFLPKDAATRAELLKLTGANITLDFLQPLRLTQPEALPGSSAAGPAHEQQHLVEPEAIAAPSTAGALLGQEHPEEPDSGNVAIVETMMEDLKRRGQEDPVFLAGLVRMAQQHQRMMSNPARILSAIHSYGRSSPTSRRAASLRRAARRQGPMIACQPTAVARRKVSAGSKRRVSAGRPVKRHSLKDSVALNTSLAKKH